MGPARARQPAAKIVDGRLRIWNGERLDAHARQGRAAPGPSPYAVRIVSVLSPDIAAWAPARRAMGTR